MKTNIRAFSLTCLATFFSTFGNLHADELQQAAISTRAIEVIEKDGFQFRDLNKNGRLDNYEDWRLSPKKRAKHLLKQMTLDEKIGQLAHSNILPNRNAKESQSVYNLGLLKDAILEQGITSFIPRVSLPVQKLAAENNTAQQIAEQSRLGIPLTISTDPRHHFQSTAGASSSGEGFSVWPETLGLAAINDPELTERFAEIVAKEYRAVGFNQALSPQADIASEPRWARSYGTFGEDPEIANSMVGAYIAGMQGSKRGLEAGYVPAIVKHWVGYGAAKDGWDSHSYYGRYASLKSENLSTHIKPFEDALDYEVSGVMPAYSIFENLSIEGKQVEQVGAGFSKVLVNELLLKKYKYQGFILSDWNILNDCSERCKNGAPEGEKPDFRDIATSWGVEELSQAERVALAMHAGVDQFGGLMTTRPLHDAIEQGLISKKLINKAVKKVLTKSFESGIFESPFVDENAVSSLVNTDTTSALAFNTQAQAITVLKRNKNGELLPKGKHKIFLYNANPKPFIEAGHEVVSKAELADFAIVRLATPYETLHPGYFFGSIHHEGSLAFAEDDKALNVLKELQGKARVIVDISLDRPAILTNILPLADVLVANFGASDRALLKALDGSIKPIGKLPFELPSSMLEVEQQDSGKPADTKNPLFPLGFSAPEPAQAESSFRPSPPTPITPSELEFIPLISEGSKNTSPSIDKATTEQWEHFFGQTIIRNVNQAAIYPVFPAPEKNNGQAVLIAPGGGYQFVSFENEGTKVASRLAKEGYTAFILKYRVMKSPPEPDAALVHMGKLFRDIGKKDLADHPPAVDDLALAIRHIKKNATQWNLNPDTVHMIGFSAGSRTTIRYLERGEDQEALTSVALMYPPMAKTIGPGARPPLFMAVAVDDPLFTQGGMNMADKWWQETGNIEFHVYSGGGHGFGMRETGATSEDWINQYLRWLKTPK